MLIRYKQSGGFAGLVKTFEAQIADLPPEDVKALTALIEASEWRRAQVQSVPSFPDAQSYEIEITDGSERKRFAFHDGDVPPSFGPLLTWLSGRSMYLKQ